jgi:hypothetical protein
LHLLNMWDPRLQQLTKFAERIQTIAERFRSEPKDPTLAAIDDLLGAVYALVSAVENEFKGKTRFSDFDAVVTRAAQLAEGQVRHEGNWMAGFHFNSAMFRISAIYHRLPQSLGGHNKAKKIYRDKTGRDWAHDKAAAISAEVNQLKHHRGTFGGRRQELKDATAAVEQLIDLAEVLTA